MHLGLDESMAALQEDDVLTINCLARLSWNTVHTIWLVEEFNRPRVHFRDFHLGRTR